jgi:outer membrane protein assembly factor BamB
MPHKLTNMTVVRPPWAIEGGRITIEGEGFLDKAGELPEIRIGEVFARIVFASSKLLKVLVPPGVPTGRVPITIGGQQSATAEINIGVPVATSLHQVDSPVFDRTGNLYVTFSGTREHQAPVSIFRVTPNGNREPFVSGIANPTSMVFDSFDQLYVSSRFEGTVYRVSPTGQVETVATDLGVASGLAFDNDGTLFVGDRSGTIFQVDQTGKKSVFASLPASVAAFHLTVGPSDQTLYVSAPTLSSTDTIYRINRRGEVQPLDTVFGRPQGLTFDKDGTLYIVEALAGASGLYRVTDQGKTEQVLTAPALVGVAINPRGGLVVTSNEVAYHLNV